jgi:hypothetical protein
MKRPWLCAQRKAPNLFTLSLEYADHRLGSIFATEGYSYEFLRTASYAAFPSPSRESKSAAKSYIS